MIRRAALLAALVAAVLAVWNRETLLMAWQEPVELEWQDPGVPGIAELDAWLAAKEAQVPALRPDAAKQIVWAGEPGARTPLSLVYVHGFSAAPPETKCPPGKPGRVKQPRRQGFAEQRNDLEAGMVRLGQRSPEHGGIGFARIDIVEHVERRRFHPPVDRQVIGVRLADQPVALVLAQGCCG